MAVHVSYHVISHVNNILTVAICVDGEIGVIVSGHADVIWEKLKRIFGGLS